MIKIKINRKEENKNGVFNNNVDSFWNNFINSVNSIIYKVKLYDFKNKFFT